MIGMVVNRALGGLVRMKRVGRLLRRPRLDRDAIPSLDGVLSREVFLGILQRERARAARNSHGFSVVAFRYPLDGRSGRITRDARFLGLLAERIRLTDAVGILSDAEAGVFLPETHGRGAEVFANRMQRMATAQWSVRPEFKVFCYPCEYQEGWLDDDARQLRFEFGTSLHAVSDREPEASVSPALDEGDGMEAYLAKPPPVWKRGFDLAMGGMGLILAAPLMLLIALHIKLTTPGPVLFKQDRIGYFGKGFKCLKFRTMHTNCEVSSHQAHLKALIRSQESMTKLDEKQDPRIIPFGRFLRISGLDELPQLFNVLRGEMSMVGPRPCIPYEYDEYDPWHRLRTEMRPGLTGLWQVSGKNRTTFTEMIRLDITYARRLSLWQDLLIVLRTVPMLAGQVFSR